MRVLLLLAILGVAMALPELATYHLGKRWGVLYPARHYSQGKTLTQVGKLEVASEELLGESRHRLRRLKEKQQLLGESRHRLRRLKEKLQQQQMIDGMMDALLGVRREAK